MFGDPSSQNDYSTGGDIGMGNIKVLPLLKDYAQFNYSPFVELIKNLRSSYLYLKNHKQDIHNLFDKMLAIYTTTKVLNSVHSAITSTFYDVLYGGLSIFVDIIQIFLLVFQIFVVSLNLISSILILLKLKGKVSRSFGHSSWCLSAFNSIMLSIVILVLYTIGAFSINMSSVFESIITDPTLSLDVTANYLFTDPNSTTAQSAFLSCFQPYNQSMYYEVFQDNETISNLDNLVNTFYNLKMYDKADPFETMYFMTILKGWAANVTDPATALIDSDKVGDSQFPMLILQKNINNIVDYRNGLPYQVINDCIPPTTFEMFIKSTDCSYVLISPLVNVSDAINGGVCLLVNNLTPQNIIDLFQTKLQNCSYKHGKYVDPPYTELFDQLAGGHKIISAYYSDYKQFRNFFSNNIILE